MEIKPYGTDGSKRDEVRQMFDNIAPTYDLLNHVLSLNIDKIWRRRTIKTLKLFKPQRILDVATGTADLAIAAHRIDSTQITGIDLSPKMIEVGQKKITKKGLTERIELLVGDAEHLPFSDQSYDAVMAAFGVRNFQFPEKNLKEMCRVTRSGGHIAVLEFMLPKTFPLKQLYLFYFKKILPLIGRIISKDFSAYQYLPESVQSFPQRAEFVEMLIQAGFKSAHYTSLAGGIAGLYVGEK